MAKNLPKIELHCHLDGSLRATTVIDICKRDNINLDSYEIEDVKKLLQIESECHNLDEYLTKFDLPNQVMQTKENLERVSFELVEDAFNENVKYIEIRFAPLLHVNKGLSVDEVIQSAIDGINKAQNMYEIKANLILGCMRHMSIEDAYLVKDSGKKFLGKGVVAIDLCGGEEEGFCYKFKDVINEAEQDGYHVTIHAGEAASAQNVIDAINLLNTKRIGHGIRICEMKEAYDLVKEKGVYLEMCPTSNVNTKAIKDINADFSKYPLYDFLNDDVNVTINTDNRTVSNIDLTNEINLIKDEFNISDEDYKKIYLNSVNASFLDEVSKSWLMSFVN